MFLQKMTKIHVITEDNDLWGAIVVTAYVGSNKVRECCALTDEEAYAEDLAAMRLLPKCTELKQWDAICNEYAIPVCTF